MAQVQRNQVVIFFLFVFMLSFPGLPCEAQERLTINTWTGPPLSRSDNTGFVDLIVGEAFKRIDVEINISRLPAERSLGDANSGRSDGEFVRIAGLDSIYPNLVQVPGVIINFEFVAFTKKLKIRTEGWQSLKPYNVGIVIGWKILEKNIVGSKSLISLRSKEILFNHLARGRVDLVVYSHFVGLEVIRQLGLKNIKTLEPPLASKPMFLYMHKKHINLVPQLAGAIESMKQDGSFDKIKQATLLPYLNVVD